MKTSYKRIPFDLETAKRITNGEMKGRIVTEDGLKARIVCFDMKNENSSKCLAVLVDCGDYETGLTFRPNGEHFGYKCNLYLEVPTYYKDFSNFVPCKWQPCLVRSFGGVWHIAVYTGRKLKDKDPLFFSFYQERCIEETFDYILPLSKVTERLIGTAKSYEELIKELDNAQGKD